MIKALAITGPTASGKTSISLDLAERFSGEIISCDSMQIYRDMNVGTAKATDAEQARVKHYMIDFLSPDEDYSAEAYKADAMRVAEEISARGRLPIFVGGTGLYIDTLIRADTEKPPESSREYRDTLLSLIKGEEDIERLWQRLCEVDPSSAAQIHKNNVRRVIRALEIFDATGKTKSYFDSLSKVENPKIKIDMITLDFHDRDNLYSRIDRRVDMMMEEGLLSEVRALYEKGLLNKNTTASQAIGYKELLAHIKGEITLAEATDLIKLSTRRYAKRQLTWFRHNRDAYRLYLDDSTGNMRSMTDVIDEAAKALNKFAKGTFNET